MAYAPSVGSESRTHVSSMDSTQLIEDLQFGVTYKRKIKELGVQFRTIIFGAVYAMEQENFLRKNFAVVGMFLEFLQLLAFVVEGDILAPPERNNSALSAWSNAAFGVISPFSFVSLEVYMILFWVFASLFAASLAITGWVGVMFQTSDFKTVWPIRFLRTFVSVMVTVMYIPILKVSSLPLFTVCLRCGDVVVSYLLAPLICDTGTGTISYFRLAVVECGDPSIAVCLNDPTGVAYQYLSVALIVIFVPFCLMMGLLAFDINPMGRNALNRANSRLEFLVLILKTVLVLLSSHVRLTPAAKKGLGVIISSFEHRITQTTVPGSMDFLVHAFTMIAFFVVCVIWLAAFTPYYRKWVNHIRIAEFSGNLAAVIGALVWRMTPLSAMSFGNLDNALVGLLCDLGFVLVTAMSAFLASYLSLRRFARSRLIELEKQLTERPSNTHNAVMQSTEPHSADKSPLGQLWDRAVGRHWKEFAVGAAAARSTLLSVQAQRGGGGSSHRMHQSQSLYVDDTLDLDEESSVDRIFIAYRKQCHTSAFALLVQAIFVLTYKGQWINALSLQRQALELQPSLDIQWGLFSIMRSAEQRRRTQMLGARDMDVITYVEYQSNFRKALHYHNEANHRFKDLWQILLGDNPNSAMLMAASERVDYADQRATKYYKLLLGQFPKAPSLWRSYSVFLDEINNNVVAADRCLEYADELEELAAAENETPIKELKKKGTSSKLIAAARERRWSRDFSGGSGAQTSPLPRRSDSAKPVAATSPSKPRRARNAFGAERTLSSNDLRSASPVARMPHFNKSGSGSGSGRDYSRVELADLNVQDAPTVSTEKTRRSASQGYLMRGNPIVGLPSGESRPKIKAKSTYESPSMPRVSPSNYAALSRQKAALRTENSWHGKGLLDSYGRRMHCELRRPMKSQKIDAFGLKQLRAMRNMRLQKGTDTRALSRWSSRHRVRIAQPIRTVFSSSRPDLLIWGQRKRVNGHSMESDLSDDDMDHNCTLTRQASNISMATSALSTLHNDARISDWLQQRLNKNEDALGLWASADAPRFMKCTPSIEPPAPVSVILDMITDSTPKENFNTVQFLEKRNYRVRFFKAWLQRHRPLYPTVLALDAYTHQNPASSALLHAHSKPGAAKTSSRFEDDEEWVQLHHFAVAIEPSTPTPNPLQPVQEHQAVILQRLSMKYRKNIEGVQIHSASYALKRHAKLLGVLLCFIFVGLLISHDQLVQASGAAGPIVSHSAHVRTLSIVQAYWAQSAAFVLDANITDSFETVSQHLQTTSVMLGAQAKELFGNTSRAGVRSAWFDTDYSVLQYVPAEDSFLDTQMNTYDLVQQYSRKGLVLAQDLLQAARLGPSHVNSLVQSGSIWKRSDFQYVIRNAFSSVDSSLLKVQSWYLEQFFHEMAAYMAVFGSIATFCSIVICLFWWFLIRPAFNSVAIEQDVTLSLLLAIPKPSVQQIINSIKTRPDWSNTATNEADVDDFGFDSDDDQGNDGNVTETTTPSSKPAHTLGHSHGQKHHAPAVAGHSEEHRKSHSKRVARRRKRATKYRRQTLITLAFLIPLTLAGGIHLVTLFDNYNPIISSWQATQQLVTTATECLAFAEQVVSPRYWQNTGLDPQAGLRHSLEYYGDLASWLRFGNESLYLPGSIFQDLDSTSTADLDTEEIALNQDIATDIFMDAAQQLVVLNASEVVVTGLPAIASMRDIMCPAVDWTTSVPCESTENLRDILGDKVQEWELAAATHISTMSTAGTVWLVLLAFISIVVFTYGFFHNLIKKVQKDAKRTNRLLLMIPPNVVQNAKVIRQFLSDPERLYRAITMGSGEVQKLQERLENERSTAMAFGI